ncbi:sugar phosphate isomerase/epimerase [Isoptericola chiayiensis]|uniref:Sugar phosphate isomerase/epimerase n=1 Tax=Isoptericola chiayiensis TaxID=579446 RepID=A0ABP8YK33_9MICO|nr:sugar phosphate isomerase/epimerase [Isoptericola chiayiensis]NOW00545.1 sugar phosphate isomerase/epimerase [Isoptericola chiayiensis]
MRRTLLTRAATAVAAAGLALPLAAAAPAAADAPQKDRAPGSASQCSGRSVPASKISFQLYSYSSWQQEIGVDAVLAELADIGYKNVEPFGGSYEGRTAEEFRALLKEHHLKAPSSHGDTDPETFDETLEFAKTLGQKYTGSGGWSGPGVPFFGGTTTWESALETAEAMNAAGERSVKAGTGKHFGHNHWNEFVLQVTDPATGESMSWWEAVVRNTDPRYVAFQVDVYWATDGGADVVELLDEYGDRIDLLHIKDGDLSGPTPAFGTQTVVGEGDIDWPSILEAAQGKVKYYVVEMDGAPTDASFARESFEYLTCLDF